MANIKLVSTWTFLVLVCLFECAFIRDNHVKTRSSVFALNGSCAILPCEIISKEDVHNYRWYYNPQYNATSKEFYGIIVYDSKTMADIDSLFKGKVEPRGKSAKDCSIQISDLQSEHSGHYQVRLMGMNKRPVKPFKWMSNNCTLTVSNISPDFKLHPVPPMHENMEVTLTCSIAYYCPSNNISLIWLQDVNGTVKVEIKNDTSEISTTTRLTFVPSWKDNNKNISCVHQSMNEINNSTAIQLDVKYAPQNVKIKAENPIIRLKEGENTTLECSVESSNPPNPKITWYKNKKPFNQEAHFFTESGIYHCLAENSEGSRKSNTVEISVLHPPKSIKIQAPKGNIKEGSSVTLDCSTVANPPVFRYIWYKNKMLCFNSTDSRYHFSSVTENDSGSYECQAFNDQGSGNSSSMELNVKYAPKNVKVVIKPDKKEFSEGDKVTFECVVNSSKPRVTNIAWYKENVFLQSFSREKALKAEDAGTYYCKASNVIGDTSSDEISVEVLYPPKNTTCKDLNEEQKREHDQATLKCETQGSNPKISHYEWFKGEKPYKTTNSDTLKFPNLQWTDSGRYGCKAINAIGSSTKAECNYLEIHYAPKNGIVAVSPGNSIIENTNVKLSCIADAYPKTLKYTWYHKNEHLQINTMEYELANIQMSQAGEYYCVIQNNIGSNKSHVIYLHVSYSSYTIGMYTAVAIGSLVILIIIVALAFHFRIRLKTCRKSDNDRSSASFFVLKKAHNELSELGQPTPSENSLPEQINYASLQFPASTNGGQSQSRTKPIRPDPNDIYSAVKKPKSTAEYENIESSKINQAECQDDIHYSIIANLNKRTAPERGPEVEYAMLKH